MAGQFMGKELVGQSHPEAGGQRPESRWTDVARGPCWGQCYSVPSSVPQSVGSVTSAGDTKLRVQWTLLKVGAIQRDLGGSKWAQGNLMRFNKERARCCTWVGATLGPGTGVNGSGAALGEGTGAAGGWKETREDPHGPTFPNCTFCCGLTSLHR